MTDPVKMEAALNAVLDLAQGWMVESDRLLAESKTAPTEADRSAAWRAGKILFGHSKAIIDAAHKELS